ncbi:hypothetical protein LEMLEM_LOCUS15439, partial [Lemmus lemmus]
GLFVKIVQETIGPRCTSQSSVLTLVNIKSLYVKPLWCAGPRAGASLQTCTAKHLVKCYFSPQVFCLLGQKLNIWREDIFFSSQQMFGVTA